MSISRRNILVVEDDPDIRESLQDILEAEGYQVLTAENGREGLERLQAMEKPCLVLLDLMMPVMSGDEFLAVLRRHEALAAVPVVVVSAWSQQARELCDQIQGFVKKPIALDALLQAVERHRPADDADRDASS